MTDETPVVEEGAPGARLETTPFLRVVSPDATPEEVAALVAVFAALGSAEPARRARRTSDWAAPSRQVRETFRHGAGGWRASSLPR